MNRITFPPKLRVRAVADDSSLDSKSIGELQATLQKLKLNIQPRELARKELGPSTTDAIRAFQEHAGLAPAGSLTAETVERLNAELEHTFVIDSKTRTRRLQEMLQRVGSQVDPNEVKSRVLGPSTKQALEQYQARAGLPQDGKVSEELVSRLREDTLQAQLSSKNQIATFHRTLLRGLNIAKLDVRVDTNELKAKRIGPSTREAIEAVQQKYGLPATGELDADTYDRLVSIAVSVPQPAKRLKVKTANELKPIKRVARLNMSSQHVGDVQRALAFLDYQIDEEEFKSKTFGKSTREAIIGYQRARLLPVTGHVAGETLNTLNREVQQANPQAAANEHLYRVRGSVRNELWEGMAGIKVQVWEKLIGGQGEMLAERPSASNGFFDIPYDPPREQATKQIKHPFYLQVKALNTSGEEIGSKLLFNPTLIAWINFTQGDQPYRSVSEFTAASAAVSKVIDNAAIGVLAETSEQRQISQAAQAAGLAADDVMRLVLAHRVADHLNHPPVGAEACYAYISQNIPPGLPGDLIASTEDWTLIDQLVDLSANGLVFMDDDLKTIAFESAVTENRIPIAVGLQKDTILDALKQLRQTYTLDKPILIGNGSLKALLDASAVPDQSYDVVADTFLAHNSFGPAFWEDLEGRPDVFGGVAAVEDLKTTVDVGHVTKNFPPMVTQLKNKINESSVQDINSARDLAKLTPERWVELINENGAQVPPGTDGQSPDDKVKTYAATMASQSEQLFPAVALAATVGRSADNPLPHVEGVQQLLDDHPELDLRTANLDTFVREQDIEVDAETLTEARVMQRVHRIAPTALAGQALLDKKIHNSAQIVSLGKERFADMLTDNELVDQRTALTVYGLAEFQYAQVLQRIADYRFDLHRADPRAIIDHTYTTEELPALAGDADLQTLFGSLDFCDCPHCQSVYGPPAYLADVLRYLDSHSSEVEGKTVEDILFDRRPDIGNIKLNCENTETPLPYIDLVCEVLENAISAPDPNPDFSFQTTRPAAELRAFPEHVRQEAYDTLKTATYPLDVAFDLWQEEARVFLQHLGVPRWELMEAFQTTPNGGAASPSDASVAGEYWGISTQETSMITIRENTAEKQEDYWGFTSDGLPNGIPTEMIVADFMRRSRLDYGELVGLLHVRWINPPDSADKMVIERPSATCNTEEQRLVNLTVDRLDQMHRFLRLWRRTGWAMWELDLLIRAAALGNGHLDENTLVRLKQFKQVQQRLGLATEEALGLYGDINTEERPKPGEPQRTVQPLYASMFLNSAVVSPVNNKFILPLSGIDSLSEQKATLQAAFALTETDLDLLLSRLNDDLTVANLSKISRYVSLARGLTMRVKDLLTLETLSGLPDIFASPEATLDFIELADWVKKSRFTLDELDYLLNYRPDSPHGLRGDVITQHVQALREALHSNTVSQPDGTIISQVASAFGLSPEQAQLLLEQVELDGMSLITRLKDPDLTTRGEDGSYAVEDISPVNFEGIYEAHHLLHKAAMLLSRLKIAKADLEWLLENAADFDMLELAALPLSDESPSSSFSGWLALHQWLSFKAFYPEPDGTSLAEVFDKASDTETSVATIQEEIAKLTQWSLQDLEDLATGLGLQHEDNSSDYASIGTYLRLRKCFEKIKRIGVGAATMVAWAKRDEDTNGMQATVVQQIRQAAKSKYDYGVWLDKLTPLGDVLREKKRDALIRYMVETSLRSEEPEIESDGKKYANPAYWRDADDLLNYFLIDVEMSACQLTSRIKQAMSSTQMFVQRCLLGLEQPFVEVSRSEQQDTVSDNSWKQWRWMKSYRLWEANRKVFLYPENWIEPELRDDKSPFFEELEAEILQKDITDENVQEAFMRYIQKVDEVARLDIVGAYYELDDTDPRDNLPPDINIFHVVERTRSHPAIYYYRRFDLNYGEWTAWEKIEVDIQSDHAIPVVYNRRLCLFWLNFIEKPQKVKKQPPAKPSEEETDTPEPPNQLEIQLAWSVREDSGWTAKRVSTQKLIHPWQRPLYSLTLRTNLR